MQGLDVEFDCLLAMRQAHGVAFGKSDMFMLCGLRIAEGAEAKAGDGRPSLTPCETVWLRLVTCSLAKLISRPICHGFSDLLCLVKLLVSSSAFVQAQCETWPLRDCAQ